MNAKNIAADAFADQVCAALRDGLEMQIVEGCRLYEDRRQGLEWAMELEAKSIAEGRPSHEND